MTGGKRDGEKGHVRFPQRERLGKNPPQPLPIGGKGVMVSALSR